MNKLNSWVLGLVCWIGLQHQVLADPTGGQVAAGSVGINGEGSSAVTIKQASNLAIINWQTFSIASGESTTFLQPSATSAALNRVLGGQTSTIDGTLKANGSIYLINGNGIVVGPGGVVNANAFTASTRDIADADFLASKLAFVGSNNAGVQNLGTISALGGDVVLIGKTVSNSGKINAPHGTAGLVAGDDVLLGQKNEDGSTIMVSPDPLATSASTHVGVNNSGKISAAAAELKAANGNIYALAIQNSGIVRATTVRKQGGHIWLTSDSGSIVNSGTLDASATAARGHGGTVTMKNMGGRTTDSGKILAQGGQGGTGGNAEVSGSAIQFNGTVDLTALGGATGDLLIDPTTLEIVASGGTGMIGSLPATGDSTINASSLVSALNGANITLNATTSISVNAAVNASGNGGAGNLTLDALTLNFNAPVSLRSGSTLSGDATTTNVGAGGLVQNGVDAAAAGATVNLAAATYDLSGQVLINKSLTVQGSTLGSTILNGQTATREMEIDGSSLGITVNLNNLTLTDGNATSNTSGLGAGRVGDGGGLLVFAEGSRHATVTINDSTISNNASVNSNGGGGIYVATNGAGVVTTTINDSTISGNTVTNGSGGGIYNDGYGGTATMNITNSTIANNTTTGNGGGIFNEGSNSNGATLTVTNSTLSGNSSNSGGGGIFNDAGSATLVIGDTILAGNTASVTDTDLENNAGTLTDHGFNIFDQGGGYVGNGTTDIEFNGNIDTLLAPLGNYGGPTETMALVAGSPAYLAGGARGSVTTDQRGDTRGSVISIGAWDYNPTQFTAANSTIVNTASDAVGDIIGGSTVSLRDALFYSNVGAVSNPTVTFNTNPANGTNFSTSQTISLTQGELVIDQSITVDGSTTGSTIVNGQNQSREMEIDGTSSGDTVTLNNLTLTDGNADAITSGLGSSRTNDGGGLLIFSQSALHATVTINNSTISNNTADNNHGGGGIYIAAQSGHATVAINDSTISGNSAYGTQGGGGIYNDGFANAVTALTITNSTIANNTATMDGTGGYGGAIYNEGAGGNSGSATVTVLNSTISGNSASNAGGGIYNDDAPATLTISDTILAGNTANGVESDLFNYNGGTVTDHGYNLYGQNGTAGGFTGNGTTDIELVGNINTVLTPLGTYGGPTATMALVVGSPAYLTGGPRTTVTTDQRGDTRGIVISIGAWDYNPTQFTAANSTIVNTASDAVGDIIGGTTISLRDALFYSNVGAVINPTITFNTNPANGTDFSTPQTISLTQGELVINKSVTVDGSTTGSTIVSGQDATREMEIDGTSSGDTVILNNLTLTDGNASSNTSGLGSDRNGDGGGLLVFTENSLHATVTINDSTISNNSAPGGNGGGGIYVATSGGGVAVLTINDSTISGNEAMANLGGGIYLDGYGGTATTMITNSTIANNASGGNGGGIFNEGPSGDSAVLTITDSTLSGNSSSTGGGGLYNNASAATVLIGDTILAGNTQAGTESDFINNGGTVTDHGYNLYGQNGTAGGFTGNGTTDIELAGGIRTAVTPLGNYGGPTETMALVAGSPAYLTGGPRTTVTTDQRGVARGNPISIGAYDGTLYLQISGSTPGATDTVDVIGGGGVLPYGTTASGNNYSIYVPESYATAGLLITDVTGSPGASTYYSAATTPTGAVGGVNLATDVLDVDGTGATSNTVLLNAAGSLNASTYDINYSVNSGTLALTTGGGVGVTINSPYTMDGGLNVGGTLTLNTGTTISALHNVSAAGFILQSGTWEQIVNSGGNGGNITGSLPMFADTGDFEVQGTSTFERFAGGSGTTGSPYQVTDVYGLQGVASPSDSLLGDSFVLGNNINATTTTNWNGGAGFVPIGTQANNYTGTFNGAGNTINGLTINLPSSDYVGLFGETGTGAILENVGLTNESIAGSQYVGGLVGDNAGLVELDYSTGTINSSAIPHPPAVFLGGLVGLNTGTGLVEESYSNVDLISGFTGEAGGLVGENEGTVEESYATGDLNLGLGQVIGGLVGLNSGGTIESCYATGAVTTTGYSSVANGGLVGESDSGTVEGSYSTGAVNSSGEFAGGLIGYNAGTVSNNYWLKDAGINTGFSGVGYDFSSGIADNNGATPETLAQLQTRSTFQPMGSGAGDWDFTAGTGVWAIGGYTSNGLLNNGVPYFQWQYPTVQLTVANQAVVYGQSPNLTATQGVTYTVAGLGGSPLSAYITGSPSLSISGGNINVGQTNAIVISATPASPDLAVEYVNGIESFTPATLTIAADTGETKTYGNNQTGVSYPTPAYTVIGLVNGDSYSGVTLGSTGYATTAGAGSYSVGTSGGFGTLSGSSGGTFAGDYDVVYAAPTANALTVGAATLTIAADTGETKTYGANLAGVSYPTPAYTVTGLVNGDSYSGVTLGSSGYASTAGAGSYSVGTSGGSGTLSGSSGGTFTGDYNVVYAAPTANALTVGAATLTIAASTGETKTYGANQTGVSYPTPAYTVTGLANGDSFTGVALGSSGYTATAGAGSYSVGTSSGSGTLSGSSGGTFASDYNVVYATPTANALTVGAATLTIAASTGETKTYGANQAGVSYPAPAYTVTGLVNGDSFNGVTLGSSGYVATAGAGSYSVGTSGGSGTLSGSSGGTFAGDYNVVYAAPTANALTVGAATLTIAADTGETKTYGANQAGVSYPAPAFTATGLVNGDSYSGVTLGSTGYASTAGTGSLQRGNFGWIRHAEWQQRRHVCGRLQCCLRCSHSQRADGRRSYVNDRGQHG